MTRENINIGATANDGTGDTLRTTATKINNNFVELYQTLGGDSNSLYGNVGFGDNSVIFEGATVDDYETILTSINATADRTILLPNASGTLILDSAEQDIRNKHLYDIKIDGDLRLHGVSGTGYYHIHYEGVVDSGTDLIINLPDLADSDTLVFQNHAETLTNKTLTAPVLTSPRVDSDINDALGNKSIHIAPKASAVNHIEVANNITGNDPQITARGTDTNINLRLSGKGTGSIIFPGKVRHSVDDYNVSGAISTQYSVALINDTSPTIMTLANGQSGQSIKFVNINIAASKVRPATFAQGDSANSFFQIQPGAAIEAIYSSETANSGVVGWYLIGLDSANGLGSQIVIK